MKTFLLLSLHKRAIFYLDKYKDCKNRINDLEDEYNVQLNSPKMGRFLITSENKYKESIARYENLLQYIEKRYKINLAKMY